METIFHEKQEGALCAQHCLNSLLQGSYYNAVDLAEIARELDEAERETMAMGNVNSPEYLDFLQQPSSNFDDSGYFSIQVICRALECWSLQMIPFNSPDAKNSRDNPTTESAYICNQQNHWLTIRKFGKQWFNLNSIKSCPELISDTYLSLLLAQLRQEGYSIFVIVGILPECEANTLLKHCNITQNDYKEYENKLRTDKKKQKESKAIASTPVVDATPAISADPADVRLKRLNYFANKESQDDNNKEKEGVCPKSPESTDNELTEEELTEEEMLKIAMEMSMETLS